MASPARQPAPDADPAPADPAETGATGAGPPGAGTPGGDPARAGTGGAGAAEADPGVNGSSPSPSPSPSLRPDRDAFRRAVGRFATGVTVLTTVVDGRHLAMTANSFVSVSLDPLLVLVSVRRDARFHDPLLAAGVWGVSVLAADMTEASRHFAGRAAHPGGGPLAGWRLSFGEETGVALLDGSIAVFECRTVDTHPGGDHTLVIGEVLALARPRPDAAPLIFYGGSYLPADPSW